VAFRRVDGEQILYGSNEIMGMDKEQKQNNNLRIF